MPEGDTIFRAARTLNRVLAGHAVTRFESVYAALMRIDHDRPIAGRTITRVTARGKHLLIGFSGDLVLHTHMRMNGSWHIYPVGTRWRAPAQDMRITLATERAVAVGFNIPVAEFLTAAQLARHGVIQALGPDLADPSFDRDDARQRIAAQPDASLEEALLDQRVICGIGNVLKSETLFVAGLHPLTRVALLDAAAIDRLLDAALRLMAMNIDASTPFTSEGSRRTTGSLDPRAKLFVYGRGGKPCRRCGTRIEGRRTGADVRVTYWCPRCQPMPSSDAADPR